MDYRFPAPGEDTRFPGGGVDDRFKDYPVDERFTGGKDTRFEGPAASSPANTTPPAIAGTPAVGQTLTVTPGVWTGTPAPALTYQWLANGAAIGGATGLTLVLAQAQAGASITCDETATNDSGDDTARSNALGPVTAPPVNTRAPVIGGGVRVGETLTVTPGAWGGYPAPSVSHAWLRDGAAIAGETGLTYLLAAEDEGTTITCRETGSNGSGNASANSNAIGPIEPEDVP